MRVKQLQPCWGFDTPAHITRDLAKRFMDSGMEFVIRYVPHWRDIPAKPTPHYGNWFFGMSLEERDILLDAGLPFGLYQMMHKSVDLTIGSERGLNMVWCCDKLGIPDGASVWCDAEYNDAPDASVITFLDDWSEPVANRLRAECYIGYEGLSGAQWYARPYFRGYARAGMMYLGNPQPRGYSVYQGVETRLHGIDIDPLFQTYDDKRERPWFVVA